MSLVRRISSASVLAATVVGAVLSLAGAAGAETPGTDSTPPGITCCAIGDPSVASLDTVLPGNEDSLGTSYPGTEE